MKLFSRRGTSDRPLSCRQVGQILQSFLDAELDDVTTDKVAEHLEDCRRCGMAADVYLEIKASLGRDAPVVPEDALRRLEAFAMRLAEGDGGGGSRSPA